MAEKHRKPWYSTCKGKQESLNKSGIHKSKSPCSIVSKTHFIYIWTWMSRKSRNFDYHRRPIFKLEYLRSGWRYQWAFLIFLKFSILSFKWLWFHVRKSILLRMKAFWKQFTKKLRFSAEYKWSTSNAWLWKAVSDVCVNLQYSHLCPCKNEGGLW